ncbi:hypothetical protein [Paraburkholderia aspalathi]|uniref:hypothetical protein n=1 Tax=Paraburkholderia aspalathi TaxID=1324617 RepID=UPI0019096AE3|nr:hypothetical protein [Paraburkholderia aspalathi]MBK3819717.1 hypothetical protein [Paraburkholderia aspalathi]MBK3831533.1 hypothetical protein [Paraburkholderia aspalathi]MBK3861313.1 hypothetical protein [Paraburkholderia aspalathi]
MPYDFFSWNMGSMPTAAAANGHAVRTFEQAAALSVCQSASQAVNALDALRPMPEKKEQ